MDANHAKGTLEMPKKKIDLPALEEAGTKKAAKAGKLSRILKSPPAKPKPTATATATAPAPASELKPAPRLTKKPASSEKPVAVEQPTAPAARKPTPKSEPAEIPPVPEVELAPKKEKAAPETKKVKGKSKRKASEITTADIALRAYYIAEKRRKSGLPGDETSDWVEAERQLRAEA